MSNYRYRAYLFLSVCLILTCSPKTNPFLTTVTPGISIVSASVRDRDTIGVFSAESISADVYVKERVRGIRFTCSGSRFQDTDMIIAAAQFSREPFTFSFSFYDTGWHSLSWVSELDNGDSIVSALQLYAATPPAPPTVRADPGDSVLLSCTPVADRVEYVWDLGDTVLRSAAPSIYYYVKSIPVQRTVSLYLTDSLHRSPACTFEIVPKTTNPPFRFSVINDSVHGDTVVTGSDRELYIGVSGPVAQLKSSTINNAPFDALTPIGDSSAVLVKKFPSITPVDRIGALILLKGTDGSVSAASFVVGYNPLVAPVKKPTLTISYPPLDSLIVNNSSFQVSGAVQDTDGYDSLHVFANVNNTQASSGVSASGGAWHSTVNLAQGMNTIGIAVYNGSTQSGTPLAAQSIHVSYERTFADTAPPVLVSVLYKGTILKNGTILPDSMPLLSASVYDAAGILSVNLQGRNATRDSSSELFTAAVPLVHVQGGALIIVTMTDSAGHTALDSIRLVYNRLPTFTALPHSTAISVDSVFTATISAQDPDKDPLALTITIVRSTGDTALSAIPGVPFSWKPSPTDTGWYTPLVRMSDGFQEVDTSLWLYVAPHHTTNLPVQLALHQSDFPDTLIANQDTLRQVIYTIPGTGTPPVLFKAELVDRGTVLLDKSTSGQLVWAPALTDTGARSLRVWASDSISSDSLTTVITVVPPIHSLLSFEQASATGPESLSTVSVNVHLSPALKTAVTVPFQVNAQLTSATNQDYALPVPATITFNPGDTVKPLQLTIINNSIVQPSRTLVLDLVAPNAQVALGTRPEFTYTILDDDIGASFATQSLSRSETVPLCSLVVAFTRTLDRTILLSWSIDSINTTAGPLDYSIVSPNPIPCTPGMSQVPIAISIVNHSVIAPDKLVAIKIAAASPNMQIGTVSSSTLHIVYNFQPNVQVSFVSATGQGLESIPATLPVQLSAASSVSITVPFTITAVSPTFTSGDYTAPNPMSVTFLPGETSKNIVIPITDDHLVEDSESFSVKLSAPASYAVLGPISSCVYTIIDNDFNLSLASLPLNAGTILQQVGGITSQGPYTLGTQVTLTAQPSPGYLFTGWSGAASGLANPLTFTIQTTSTITANFTRATSITQQPQDATVAEGQSATFQVAAAGTNVQYQWQKNSADISQATGAAYTFTAAGTDSGSLYRCIVRSTPLSDTSRQALLNVKLLAPQIVQQPQGLHVASGTKVVFVVGATGSKLQYQWQANSVNITGATADSLSLVAAYSDSGATYRCSVSNSGGSVMSNQALLQVDP